MQTHVPFPSITAIIARRSHTNAMERAIVGEHYQIARCTGTGTKSEYQCGGISGFPFFAGGIVIAEPEPVPRIFSFYLSAVIEWRRLARKTTCSASRSSFLGTLDATTRTLQLRHTLLFIMISCSATCNFILQTEIISCGRPNTCRFGSCYCPTANSPTSVIL